MPEEEQPHSAMVGKIEVSEHGQFTDAGPTLYSVRIPWTSSILVSYRPANEANDLVQEYINWLLEAQQWIRDYETKLLATEAMD